MKTICTASLAALILVAGCKSDSKPATPPAAKTADPTTKAAEPAAEKDPVTDDLAKSLAGKPKTVVAIEAMGVSIEVPEGTTVTPPRDADEGKRMANLKQGEFMVNLRAVDEFSTPSFAKAKEISKSDTLVASIRAEETSTGWITFNEIVSGMYKANRFEVGVRTQVGGKKWDCGVSAPSKALGELALAACQSVK